MASSLPWEAVHGELGAVVRDRWESVDAFVLFASVGIATRVVGPLLRDKAHDPAVLCVDEAGRWVVVACGGHEGGGNSLASTVAALLGATPVITTATDAVGLSLPFPASGDVAGIMRRVLDGTAGISNPLGWPLPSAWEALPAGSDVVVTDSVVGGSMRLHPPTLVVGVGLSSLADAVGELASAALSSAGLALASVAAVATIDRRAAHPAVLALAREWDVPVVSFSAAVLDGVAVPNPSSVVASAVGTASVAEAAALLGAGVSSVLVVEKQRSETATVAVARRSVALGSVALGSVALGSVALGSVALGSVALGSVALGSLSIVGLGPGQASHRTPAATAAVRHADVVIGYGPYIDQAADALPPSATVIRSPIGSETSRARQALSAAASGRRVALVCSGDAGVYAMATLVMELAPSYPTVLVDVVPGVTAALAAAAVLGAPLGHDHAVISLSDLLTPWEVISGRLRAAAIGDFVVALYNPRSARRDWQLAAATSILLEHRSPETPVGIVTDAGRPTQKAVMTSLSCLPDLPAADVTMTSCVLIGSSTTRVIEGRMVTPRGYRQS
jgi:cobalt-precorrin 5A hydrolase/precorrin-3B C17-methyltransferase